MAASIRDYRAADRAGLRRVAYETGLFGDSIAPLCPDRELFADLWTSPYTDGVVGPRLVAVDESEVVGYIVGATSPAAMPAAYGRTALLALARLARGQYRAWRESLPYLMRVAREGSLHAPAERYPAHLHLNLLPQARGQGLGGRLLDAFLYEVGPLGVQLATTDRNLAAAALYEKRGFRVIARSPTRAFAPVVPGPVERLLMAREPG